MKLRGEQGLNLRVFHAVTGIQALSEFSSAMIGNQTPPEAEESERSADFIIYFFSLKVMVVFNGKGECMA